MLAQKMVETEKNHIYPLVYQLLKLASILPVAPAMVERVLSVSKLLAVAFEGRKTDEWRDDCKVLTLML